MYAYLTQLFWIFVMMAATYGCFELFRFDPFPKRLIGFGALTLGVIFTIYEISLLGPIMDGIPHPGANALQFIPVLLVGWRNWERVPSWIKN